MENVEPCTLEDIYHLAAKAREDGIDAKPRPESQWYRYGEKGIICLWEPQNRSDTKRISHWWVDEDYRDEGVGEALLNRAVFDADNSDTTTIDIYAFDPEPLQDRGFAIEDEQPDARAYYLVREG